jgi:hypothetical protein
MEEAASAQRREIENWGASHFPYFFFPSSF